jgi:hypothetical protein
MEDKRRKPKLPIRTMPAPVAWILNNATMEQLDYLNRMAKSGEFKTFINLISRFKQYNIETVFRYEAKSEADLTYFRASKRGEVAGLDTIIMVAQYAQDEVERRRKVKV